jgi:uncharacterized protein YndB with AHSA1/START domain
LSNASLELLAPRADVWAFLAEPYHLADWWPGLQGVEPDRRGFAPGARWKARITTTNPFVGRRPRETLLLIRDVHLYERWSWHLVATKLDVEIRLRATTPERTLVEVSASRGRRSLAGQAVKRLYDLCQTAAEP